MIKDLVYSKYVYFQKHLHSPWIVRSHSPTVKYQNRAAQETGSPTEELTNQHTHNSPKRNFN